jgi:hypothetical protein
MGRLHARSFLLAAAAVAAALVCSSGPAHVAAAAAAAESSSELVLVYSIQRHGARNVLPKSADLRESDAAGGPTLLLAGRQQCHAAGRAFRARYISRPSCAAAAPPLCLSAPGAEQYGVINSRGVGFHNYNTVANSSALDRTIMSAGAFLAGVFAASAAGSSGGGQVVPVYSVSEGNDWLIRGYAHCPAYRRRLSAWLAGQEFAAQADATAQLRSKVRGAAVPVPVPVGGVGHHAAALVAAPHACWWVRGMACAPVTTPTPVRPSNPRVRARLPAAAGSAAGAAAQHLAGDVVGCV